MSALSSQGASETIFVKRHMRRRTAGHFPRLRTIAPCLLSICLLLQTISCGHAAPSRSFDLTHSPTDIAITAKVLQSGVKRFGINIGGETFYDSGQMLRNLILRNPGFEAETWQSILRCKSATATTCTDGNQFAVWPKDFLKNARFQFLSGRAAGLWGTILSSDSGHFPDSGVAFAFTTLARAPSAGDFVMVRFSQPGDADKGWWTNSMQSGATFTTELGDLSPNSPGKQALRIHASGVGQAARLDSYFDTYIGRSFVQLKGRYTLSFRAKGIGGSNSITLDLVRAGTPQRTLFPSKAIRLSNAWKDYSYDWIAAEDGAQRGPVDLSFNIRGADVLLDDVSLTADAATSNPTAFRDEVVDALRDLHPGLLRYTDTGAATASTVDNMIAVPFARERAGYSTQATVQEQIPLGLHEFLELCKAVQAEPWYSLPATATPEEASHLIEYLGGSPTTPYGARRAALGQSIPWTDVFPVIHLEFGNELWNAGTFYGASMADPVLFGKRAAEIFFGARKSSSFLPAKFDLVLGSFAANPWWTSQELANSAGYSSVAVAPYLFNKLDDVSSLDSVFGSMFAEPESIDSQPGGMMSQQAKAARTALHPVPVAVYEVNLSTDQGNAPQSAVNAVVPSLGGGLTVMEHMLLMLRDLGITTQCTYSLPGYANKFNNPDGKPELTPLWGTVIDMGGPTNRRRPLFLAEQLTNQVILADLLETKLSGANPTWSQQASKSGDVQLDKAHKLQVFAFREGNRHSLIVFNLDRQNSLPITLSGDSPSGLVRLSQLTAPHITDTNEEKEAVRITHSEVPNFKATTPYFLAPFSMTAFEWTLSGSIK